MSFQPPPRRPAPEPGPTAALIDATAQRCLRNIVHEIHQLDVADKNRVLLKVRSHIDDTLEALETNTER